MDKDSQMHRWTDACKHKCTGTHVSPVVSRLHLTMRDLNPLHLMVTTLVVVKLMVSWIAASYDSLTLFGLSALDCDLIAARLTAWCGDLGPDRREADFLPAELVTFHVKHGWLLWISLTKKFCSLRIVVPRLLQPFKHWMLRVAIGTGEKGHVGVI